MSFEGKIVILSEEISIIVCQIPEFHLLVEPKTNKNIEIVDPEKFTDGWCLMGTNKLALIVGHVDCNYVACGKACKGDIVSSDGDWDNGMFEKDLEGDLYFLIAGALDATIPEIIIELPENSIPSPGEESMLRGIEGI